MRRVVLLAGLAIAASVQGQFLAFDPALLPFNDTLFGSTVSLKAVPNGITPAKIEFLLDGVVISTDTTAPYTAQFTGLKAGFHKLRARANPEIPGADVSRTVEVVPLVGTAVLADEFTIGHAGWAYLDDAFRGTHQPKYAAGYFGPTERLWVMPRVELGGLDGSDITGMSGGYVTTFVLKSAAPVQVRFRYAVERGQEFEPDETFDVMVSVDNVQRGVGGADYVARIIEPDHGDTVTVPLGQLAAGAHRLVLGGYANKKTQPRELAFVGFDWVLVETVPAVNVLPKVAFTSPPAGATVPEGTVNFTASASDANGSVTYLEFYPEASAIWNVARVEGPPYSFSYQYPNPGKHTAKLVAVDNYGERSAPALLNFSLSSSYPFLTITSPTTTGELRAKPGTTLPVALTLTDPAGVVKRLEISRDNVVEGTDLAAPYAFNVKLPAEEGRYEYIIRAWDNVIPVTIAYLGVRVLSNLPPTLTITSPEDGSLFPIGATITVKATASDPDGTISRVELINGSNQLTDTVAPYEFVLTGLPQSGDDGVAVVAYDNLGRPVDDWQGVTFSIGQQVRVYHGNYPSPNSEGPPFYFRPGDTVTVTADPAPSGTTFDQWTGTVADLDNPANAVAKVKVPSSGHVDIEAIYKPATNPTLINFVLINAETDQPIGSYTPLYNGAVLSLSKLPTRHLNVKAVTSPATTGSVMLVWDAGTSTFYQNLENEAPYSLGNDTAGNYRWWTPTVGLHTLTAWAYSGKDGSGTRSMAATINMRVVE